ncbi:hypothetical protein EIN_217980 [Entamoeba invadens IP1]|uniref:Leucine rich repeat containing protein BspA family protein n=1 Tax=Entamoeba invadens IP1 TaxID=370355 RepID=L7FNU1_ENTIV|nr:hypothetical protein EIN_217980 [Entamoeba invadens IP1]ELP95333.1 hypothetical protein EIN_217980 [Entamoeba invadens IP1]|eukprot:XP_004262104.1 hypothetical protein EIN_217980 [Entamoeba invadens IP1]
MSQLDGYHLMVVSQYFSTIQDFISIEFVCKRYLNNMERYHANPIPLTLKTIKYFPKIETLNIWSYDDEFFGNDIFNTIKTKTELKIDFYRINVWFNVDYTFTQTHRDSNFTFKSVTYTKEDREKYGPIIPNTINRLGNNCFESSNVVSLQIPDSVTSLGNFCFNLCGGLASVTLPKTLKEIGKYCFYYCESLRDIVVPQSVTAIGEYCFGYCNTLATINFSNSISELPDNCFYACYNLQNISFESRLKSIGEYCFGYCHSLKSVKIPYCESCIKNCAFFDCGNLTSITINGSVNTFGYGCFYRCSSLALVNIPSGVSDIGEMCFNGCESLRSISLPIKLGNRENISYISYSNLDKVVLTKNVGRSS